MVQPRSVETLRDLFASETVVDLPRIRVALGGVSSMTAFRYLRQIPYRRSYNHNGRFYCLHEPSRYDRLGLWSAGDVHFSMDGGLGETVRRMVNEMESGATHRELAERLSVRVQNTLLTLLRRGEIERERLAQLYVYLHRDAAIRQQQGKPEFVLKRSTFSLLDYSGKGLRFTVDSKGVDLRQARRCHGCMFLRRVSAAAWYCDSRDEFH